MKELLAYYKRELTELQKLGEVFAKKHPKIAAQLGLREHTIKDPNISRLIESVALMNARINYKLDDDFSEISEALLAILFPSYMAPIPPLSIVQFSVMSDVSTTVTLPRDTAIEAVQPDTTVVRFKTCYDVDLLPLDINSALLTTQLPNVQNAEHLKHSAGVLKLSLRALDKQTPLNTLGMRKIRFFIRGLTHHTYPLYELLFNHLNGIVLRNPEKESVILSTAQIKQVGFNFTSNTPDTRNEMVLPYDSRTPLGYHLLNEYFVFPEKFLFFDLILPASAEAYLHHPSMDIFFYVNDAPLELQKNINAKTFSLNCTPIINLFTKTLEPLALSQTESDFLLTPDIREPERYEIYQIQEVWSTTVSEDIKTYLPFYGFTHFNASLQDDAYWYAQRKPLMNGTEGQDMFLNLVDAHFKPVEDETLPALHINASCFNRTLDNLVLTDPEKSHYQLSDASAPINHIQCLMPFTAVMRRPLRNGLRWQMISHLAAQHLNLAHPDITQLKEILRLYDFKHTEEMNVFIESLSQIKTQKTLLQITLQGIATFVQGIEVHLTLDKNVLSDSSIFLFASILEKFMLRHASLNSCIQLIVTDTNNHTQLYKSKPRLGQREAL